MASNHVHYHLPPGTSVYPCTHLKPPTPPPTHYHCTPCQSPHSPHRSPTRHSAPPTPGRTQGTRRVHRLSTLLNRVLEVSNQKIHYLRTPAFYNSDQSFDPHLEYNMDKILRKEYINNFGMPEPEFLECREKLKHAMRRCLDPGSGGFDEGNLRAMVWAVERFERREKTVGTLTCCGG